MVNENNNINLIAKENYKKVEEVREIENKVPSFEEFMKSYEGGVNYADLSSGDIRDSEGYGPCKNSLCGCRCLSINCFCKGNVKSVFTIKDVFGVANVSAFGRAEEGSVGWNDRSGEVGVSAIRIKDNTGDAKFLGVSIGGEIIDENNAKVRLGVDLVNLKSDGFQARAGLNVDTGFSNGSNGVEAKLAGFGFTLGNQVGISTPIGEVKFDKDNCVVQ